MPHAGGACPSVPASHHRVRRRGRARSGAARTSWVEAVHDSARRQGGRDATRRARAGARVGELGRQVRARMTSSARSGAGRADRRQRSARRARRVPTTPVAHGSGRRAAQSRRTRVRARGRPARAGRAPTTEARDASPRHGRRPRSAGRSGRQVVARAVRRRARAPPARRRRAAAPQPGHGVASAPRQPSTGDRRCRASPQREAVRARQSAVARAGGARRRRHARSLRARRRAPRADDGTPGDARPAPGVLRRARGCRCASPAPARASVGITALRLPDVDGRDDRHCGWRCAPAIDAVARGGGTRVAVDARRRARRLAPYLGRRRAPVRRTRRTSAGGDQPSIRGRTSCAGRRRGGGAGLRSRPRTTPRRRPARERHRRCVGDVRSRRPRIVRRRSSRCATGARAMATRPAASALALADERARAARALGALVAGAAPSAARRPPSRGRVTRRRAPHRLGHRDPAASTGPGTSTGFDAARDLGEPGAVPLHARRPRRHVPRPALDDAPVRRASAPPRRPTSASSSCSPRARPACRAPSTCPPRWATTRTTRAPRARSGAVGVAISLDRGHARSCSTGCPLDEVTTSMTINATAATLLLLYQLVAEEQGVDRRRAARHDPERHPEGVRRARHLHLPAAALDAPHHRHLRLLRERAAAAGTRSRSPATTSARPARPRSRRSPSPSPTASPTCEAALAAGLDVDDFAPRLSFFFNAHNNLFEEVAKFRAARRLWARIMSERFGAKRPALDDAALPHPDRRLDAHRPAAREQRRARDASRRSPRSWAAPSRLHTNGFDEALGLPTEHAAQLALRTQQVAGLRVRRRRHRRPARRLLLRRERSPTRSSARARDYLDGDRRARRRGRGHRGGLPAGRDRGRGLRRRARASTSGEQRGRGREPVRRRARPARPRSSRSTTSSRARQVERVVALQARAATRDAVARGAAATSRPPRAAAPTCSTR